MGCVLIIGLPSRLFIAPSQLQFIQTYREFLPKVFLELKSGIFCLVAVGLFYSQFI